MVQTVTAVYENGVLYPKVPLSLKEKEEVQIQIIVPDNSANVDYNSDLSEPNDALDREMQAYIAMHPQLKEKFFGQHVAIFQEELIDHDENYDNLIERVREKYPTETVWISTVSDDAIRTVHMRSPRLVKN